MREPDAKLELSKAALELRAASPTRWAEFLKALAACSDVATTKCVNSSLEVLPTAQGRAQQMRELLNWLVTAPETIELAKHLRTPHP